MIGEPPVAVFALTDLGRFLGGSWRITRRIADRRALVASKFTGTADFEPASGGLRYSEHGMLCRGSSCWEARQTYWYSIRGPRAEVRFADGRFFHALDISSGSAEVVHECAPDRYRGRFRICDQDCWTQGWRVEGPRKRMLIATHYARVKL